MVRDKTMFGPDYLNYNNNDEETVNTTNNIGGVKSNYGTNYLDNLENEEKKSSVSTVPSPALPAAPKVKYSSWDDVLAMMNAHTETDKQRMARERSERRRSVASGMADLGRAMANLYYTSQYAPNAYDPTQSMSAKTRERFEKAKADRDKDRDWWLRYSTTMAGLNGADADRAMRDWRYRMADAQAEREYNLRLDDINFNRNYRQGRDKVADDQWKQQFDFGSQQAAIRNENEKSRTALAWAGYNQERNSQKTDFVVPGYGTVSVDNDVINNPANISRAYAKINGGNISTTDKYGRTIVRRPTIEEMKIELGKALNDPTRSEQAAEVILEMAGKKAPAKVENATTKNAATKGRLY